MEESGSSGAGAAAGAAGPIRDSMPARGFSRSPHAVSRPPQILLANPAPLAYSAPPAALQQRPASAHGLFGGNRFSAWRSSFNIEEMPMSAITTTASGLTIEDTVIGKGAAAASGRDVVVHYAGWLADGTQFDSSREKQDPFEFTLGKKEVMDGWEEGLRGMKVGGTRKLVIPPQLAYGEDGAGDTIPPNETLTFEVELLSVS
jgi:FKBP-type peptidyl-prolyl cis-trans isomerase FkpA